MSGSRQDHLDECISTVYDSFIDQPFTYYSTHNAFVEMAREIDGVDKSEAEDLWQLFSDRYVKPRPGKRGDLLNEDFIRKADDLGEDVPVDPQLQDELKSTLEDAYLDDPSHPQVSRDDLHSSVQADESTVDLNLYVLKLRGYVEVNQTTGLGNDGYVSAQLTELARRQLS